MYLPRFAPLVLMLPLQSFATTPLSAERSAQLSSYCVAARPFLRHDVLDPAMVPTGSIYLAPRPTVMMGHRIQSAGLRFAMQGKVVLGLVVNSVGRTAHVAVLEKSGYPAFDREAVSILEDSRFAPATLDGAPTRACMTIRFVFKLAAG